MGNPLLNENSNGKNTSLFPSPCSIKWWMFCHFWSAEGQSHFSSSNPILVQHDSSPIFVRWSCWIIFFLNHADMIHESTPINTNQPMFLLVNWVNSQSTHVECPSHLRTASRPATRRSAPRGRPCGTSRRRPGTSAAGGWASNMMMKSRLRSRYDFNIYIYNYVFDMI